jgi:NADH-quinone oxidoreductase subunit M
VVGSASVIDSIPLPLSFDSLVLTIIVALPFAAAAALILWPRQQITAMRWFALATALVATGLTAYVTAAYDYGYANTVGGTADTSGRFQFVQQWPWLDDLGISFHVGVDGIAVPMLLMTGIIYPAAVAMTWTTKSRVKDYLVLLNLLVGGVLGTFALIDLFFLFFFFEIAVLPMYLLIAYWGSTSRALRNPLLGREHSFDRTKEYSAMKLVMVLVAGSVLIWIALFAIYVVSAKAGSGLTGASAGTFGGTFDLLALKNVTFTPSFQKAVFPFVLIGFGVLAGLWPLHTWSPDGHVAAPTSVSMLHAGVLMKLGAFGIIRVGMELFPDGARAWMPLLLVLGSINVIYGSLSAFSQRDLKYVIGYSSVSHMGYVLVGLATLNTLGVTGAVLQMFSHGIMTALLFAVVGVVYERAHTRDMTSFEGLAKVMPIAAFFFAVAGLASLGLPGLSGFVAELLVFIGLFKTYPIAGALAVIGAAIAAAYILRLMAKVFFGPAQPRWAGLADMTVGERTTAGVLALTLLVVGLAPFYLIKLIDSGVKAFSVVTG